MCLLTFCKELCYLIYHLGLKEKEAAFARLQLWEELVFYRSSAGDVSINTLAIIARGVLDLTHKLNADSLLKRGSKGCLLFQLEIVVHELLQTINGVVGQVEGKLLHLILNTPEGINKF